MVELAGLAATATLKEEVQTVALVGGQVVKANIPRQALEAGGSEVGVAAAKGVGKAAAAEAAELALVGKAADSREAGRGAGWVAVAKVVEAMERARRCPTPWGCS